MIINKYEAKNLTDHTVILKINTIPIAIQCGKTEVIEYFPKDIVLYPKGSLELTKIGESKSASEPKEMEKNETITASKVVDQTNEEIVTEITPEVEKVVVPEVEKVVIKTTSKTTNRNGRKTKDVKIETEEK